MQFLPIASVLCVLFSQVISSPTPTIDIAPRQVSSVAGDLDVLKANVTSVSNHVTGDLQAVLTATSQPPSLQGLVIALIEANLTDIYTTLTTGASTVGTLTPTLPTVLSLDDINELTVICQIAQAVLAAILATTQTLQEALISTSLSAVEVNLKTVTSSVLTFINSITGYANSTIQGTGYSATKYGAIQNLQAVLSAMSVTGTTLSSTIGLGSSGGL